MRERWNIIHQEIGNFIDRLIGRRVLGPEVGLKRLDISCGKCDLL